VLTVRLHEPLQSRLATAVLSDVGVLLFGTERARCHEADPLQAIERKQDQRSRNTQAGTQSLYRPGIELSA